MILIYQFDIALFVGKIYTNTQFNMLLTAILNLVSCLIMGWWGLSVAIEKNDTKSIILFVVLIIMNLVSFGINLTEVVELYSIR
jgi:hypothetical protein